MTKIIGVRFRNNGRVYFFDPGLLDIKEGDSVVVETAHGIEMGYVSRGISDVEDSEVVAPLVPVLRIATEEDFRMREMYTAKESEAFNICAQKIEQHKLDMKLVRVEYAFNGSKVVFYFTADERVDFRELVKDLAFQFRTRIELRQIGVRDEAKMLGGLGPCGRPICCKQFLDDFSPVSIKMAKEQNLSLSPTKISGLCGRLMCCLQYEEYAYEEMKKLMPRVGKDTVTPDGLGTVLENNAITELTKVKIQLPDGSFDQRWYHYSFLRKPGEGAVNPCNRPENQSAVAEDEESRSDAVTKQISAKPSPEAVTDSVTDNASASSEKKRTQRPQRPRREHTDANRDSKAKKDDIPVKSDVVKTDNSEESRKDKRPPRPQRRPKAAEKSDANSSAVPTGAAETVSKAPTGQDDEAVKQHRHRGGRKHRPHKPKDSQNNSTPSED